MPHCNTCDGEGGRESRLPGKGFVKCDACGGRGTDTPGVLSSKVMIRMGDKSAAEARERNKADAHASAKNGRQQSFPPRLSTRDNMAYLARERAVRAGNAALWKPRDALEDAIRKIDSGEVSPDLCVIVFKQIPKNGKSWEPGYSIAGSFDPDLTYGALHAVARMIHDGASTDD